MIYLVFSSHFVYKDLDRLLRKSIHRLLNLRNYSNYIDFLLLCQSQKGRTNKLTIESYTDFSALILNIFPHGYYLKMQNDYRKI